MKWNKTGREEMIENDVAKNYQKESSVKRCRGESSVKMVDELTDLVFSRQKLATTNHTLARKGEKKNNRMQNTVEKDLYLL